MKKKCRRFSTTRLDVARKKAFRGMTCVFTYEKTGMKKKSMRRMPMCAINGAAVQFSQRRTQPVAAAHHLQSELQFAE